MSSSTTDEVAADGSVERRESSSYQQGTKKLCQQSCVPLQYRGLLHYLEAQMALQSSVPCAKSTCLQYRDGSVYFAECGISIMYILRKF